jgi:ParB family transcriptional regulator, chromosome partitioning protein
MKKKKNSFLDSIDALDEGVNDVFTKKLTSTDLLLSDIIVKKQIRKEFENKEQTLEDLAESIKADGVIQPLVVRHSDTGYELIAGGRRYKAAMMAGLTSVPVVIKYVDTKAAMLMQFVENIHRKDLTLLEEAEKLKELRDEYGSSEKVIKRIGKNKFWFSQRLALLELPEHAKRLAGDKVTQDAKLIHEVKAIEKINPDKAKDLVDRLINKTDKRKARDVVEEVKRVVVPPKVVTITQKQPLDELDSYSVKATDVLLERIYDDFSKTDVSFSEVFERLSATEHEHIKRRLNEYYVLGRNEGNRAGYVLNALRSRVFSYNDFRSFYLVAFMHGIDHKFFAPTEILESARDK